MNSLRDRVALVIGGNSGLGKASAVALAEAGAKVMVAARREAENIAFVEQLRALGAEAESFVVDVTVASWPPSSPPRWSASVDSTAPSTRPASTRTSATSPTPTAPCSTARDRRGPDGQVAHFKPSSRYVCMNWIVAYI